MDSVQMYVCVFVSFELIVPIVIIHPIFKSPKMVHQLTHGTINTQIKQIEDKNEIVLLLSLKHFLSHLLQI